MRHVEIKRRLLRSYILGGASGQRQNAEHRGNGADHL
jgi:hypothetical protein